MSILEDEQEAIAKPNELLALHDVTAEMFGMLQRWFNVPEKVTLDLSEVDAAVLEMGDPVMVAAMAMRKLQALHLLSTPGVRTTTDMVVTIVQDLQRALIQAPAMRLKLAAAHTDWDAELVLLEAPQEPQSAQETSHPAGQGINHEPPRFNDEPDAEADHFALLHEKLIKAAEAVIIVSDGEIRYLI